MKASLILALPALAVAAATPHQVEERQLPSLFDPACLLQITGITQCLPNLSLDSIVGIVDVIGCPFRLAGQIANCLNVPGTK
ncbi:hypothetical protein FOPG_15768 [Fusarium oxysporum f. sp. conglutinans race 2 54008]|uniref:Hydrophobin n=2 Tax=Fusarium oxysporum f. sp. conglutinans TaxID=100902 RepID=A0A8H6GB84_FUSOX|nr:hypothetical protein FOPG_15768 [Fusarium oxysporum f. sp. conglutinans race 2 54008]KAF6514752.1 hypothetical protein HZS61_005886 [Fusarium oxysporum f. sp. conglutinans]KAG7003847.1 hypothetical protein FocnCong_v001567 [Fusarium oxysporum f. sp. conglutinans]KAI8400249.1 hypothetical protein FOFC_19077 [Fusarium oxysporum]